MLIPIIGPHGSGKSTLINEVINKKLYLPQYKIMHINEVARLCPYTIGSNSNRTAQTWIMRAQLILERYAVKIGIPTLLDRCIIDHYAYYQYWVGCNDEIESYIIKSLENYSKIFLLPANPEYLVDDSVRPININFLFIIESMINEIISKLHIPVIRLTKSFKDSIDAITKSIKQLDSRINYESSYSLTDLNSSLGKEYLEPFSTNDISFLITNLSKIVNHH